MNLRAYHPYDRYEAYKIWETFFKEEFDFPDFLKGFHCAFIIEDKNEEPIVFGGVRPIAELIAVTNKNKTSRDRVMALKKLVEASVYVASEHNYDQLHCFVQGDNWSRQVQTVHFRPTKGQSLYIDI
jgi:hypothetical protein